MKKIWRLVCSVVLLALLLTRINWHQVVDSFSHLHWGLWLLALGLFVGAQAVSSLRWQMLARPLGFDRPLSHFFAFYLIGMFFNLVLPTSVGGDVVRAWYLAEAPERRVAAFLSVFAERLSGLLVLLLIACAATLANQLGGWIELPPSISWSVWVLTACGFLGLGVLAIVCRLPLPGARFQKLHARLVHCNEQLAAAFGFYAARPRLLLITTLLSLVVQVANVLLVWLLGLAIEAPVPAAYYWILVPLVAIITLLPVSVGGVGVREGGMVVLLAPLHVAAGTAVSLSFLWFATCSLASVAGAGFYLFGRYPRPSAGLRTEDEGLRGRGVPTDAAHSVLSPQSSTLERSDDGPVGGDSDQGRTRQPGAAA